MKKCSILDVAAVLDPPLFLKRVKAYLMSTMGNKWLHALMLMHVHKNILDNINLAGVAIEFVDRRDSQKKTFGHFSQNDS